VGRQRKIWGWGAGGLGALFFLLIVIALALPKLINLSPVKEKILANISRAVGGDVACEGVALSLLPRPRVLIHEGSISIPERLAGSVASVTVYPKILPLFTADLRLAKLLVEGPAITVTIPEGLTEGKERKEGASPATFEQKMAPLLEVVSSSAPGLVVQVKNGILNVLEDKKSLFSLRSIDARVSLPPKGIKIDMACKSDLWESFSLEAQMSPQVSLELEGRGVDVPPTRKAVLALAGSIRAIQKIFDILQGGEATVITFRTHGSSVMDLAKLENIFVKGSLREGKISIAQIGMDLEEVHGDVVISHGILEGSNIEARLENARGRELSLSLGLRGRNAPFHLEAEIETDLVQLRSHLRQFVKNKTFLEEMDGVHDIRGQVMGRLILGESIKAITPSVDVSRFDLSGDYHRIPYPVEVHGGHFAYDETGVHVENVRGMLGKSAFSDLSADLQWGAEPYLEVTSGQLQISLDEIYPWLASFEEMGNAAKDIRSIAGSLTVSPLSGKGPLYRPKEWQFSATGDVKDLAVETSLLSGPIEVVRGGFHAVDDGTRQELSFTEAQLTALDASLKVSGALSDYLVGLNGADLSLEGKMGSESIEWFSRAIGMSPLLKPRSPLSISNGHLAYSGNAAASFQGDLVVQMGPKVTIDILKEDQKLCIRNMQVQDQDTSANLKLDVTREAFNLDFSGYLTKATMKKLFEEAKAAQGWVEGNMLIHFLKNEPAKSKVHGRLKGGDLLLPFGVKGPLEIDNISLDTKENTLRVNAADFTWEDNRVAAKGDVHFADEGLQLDLDLSTKDLGWQTISNAFGRSSETEKGEGDLYALPLCGKVRLDAERFTYGRFAWTPFHADVAFTQDQIDVAIVEANLCSIATPGTLRVTPHNISLHFESASTNQDLGPAFTCFLEEKNQMTGSFSFAGEIRAQERPGALLESARGDLTFVAKDGRIHRYGVLAKVLAFVNVTEVFRGKIPDFAKEGFPYDSIEAEALLEDGKLIIKGGLIMGPSVEIAFAGEVDLINEKYDLTYLVAPLKTVDSVVKRIPILGRVLGGTVVSIPVKVTGDWSDPTVKPLSASAVGAGVLGIMERAVKLPVEILELLPASKKTD